MTGDVSRAFRLQTASDVLRDGLGLELLNDSVASTGRKNGRAASYRPGHAGGKHYAREELREPARCHRSSLALASHCSAPGPRHSSAARERKPFVRTGIVGVACTNRTAFLAGLCRLQNHGGQATLIHGGTYKSSDAFVPVRSRVHASRVATTLRDNSWPRSCPTFAPGWCVRREQRSSVGATGRYRDPLPAA